MNNADIYYHYLLKEAQFGFLKRIGKAFAKEPEKVSFLKRLFRRRKPKGLRLIRSYGKLMYKHPFIGGIAIPFGVPAGFYAYHKYSTNPEVVRRRYLAKQLKGQVDQYMDYLRSIRSAV